MYFRFCIWNDSNNGRTGVHNCSLVASYHLRHLFNCKNVTKLAMVWSSERCILLTSWPHWLIGGDIISDKRPESKQENKRIGDGVLVSRRLGIPSWIPTWYPASSAPANTVTADIHHTGNETGPSLRSPSASFYSILDFLFFSPTQKCPSLKWFRVLWGAEMDNWRREGGWGAWDLKTRGPWPCLTFACLPPLKVLTS